MMFIQQKVPCAEEQERMKTLLSITNVMTPSIKLTLELSVKNHPPKLPTKCCLQSYLSETFSCNSPVRSGSFFLGGRLSCRQGKWRKNNESKPSHALLTSLQKLMQ